MLPGQLDQKIKKDFESNKRVLSFDEYTRVLAESPERQLRGAAKYAADMMDYFGKTAVDRHGHFRFKVFDLPIGGAARKVVGQEAVQNQIYRALRAFARQRTTNKLLLLHGPNGSAKSSIARAMMAGFEKYSETPEGAAYTFNWIFPVEKVVKGSIGLGASHSSHGNPKDPGFSYARLSDDEVLSKIPCELKDHPLLLVPVAERREFLAGLLGGGPSGKTKADEIWNTLPHALTQGELCHRCKQVFDAQLLASGGDFRKVMMHVQVERFYLSARYRKGLVTIEPQLHVDAQYQQLTMARGMGALPPSLQGLNLFSLSGDLVDGNRGMIEFSDLLKRPVDSFKYLLMACETGSVNVGHAIAHLDTVLLGSANELQLDAFKEFPDFMSFKARIELIRVPYLLSVSQEREIYEPDLAQIRAEKHVAPHVSWTLAFWSVLTRLKKPNSINFPPEVSTIISQLTPLDKARLYDTGEMPVALGPEDRKMLKANLPRLRDEYVNIPYYEGRMGASAREMKALLYAAAENSDYPCLSPLAVLRELEDFVKRVSEYEFLKQDVKDGYHDSVEFITQVRTEYLNRIDREVRDSIGIYDSQQWEDFLRRYVQHTSLVLKKEKIKNSITGKMEDPDLALIQEFEKIVDAPDAGDAREAFRQNIISTVGAWSLDHAGEPVVYARVFPEYWQKLEKHYFESQKTLLTKMHNALALYGTDDPSITEEGNQLAQKTVANMTSRKDYCDKCAKEVITFLMKQRY